MRCAGWAAAMAVAALGCGADPIGEQGKGLDSSLQPMGVGTTWTYLTSKADGSEQERKTTSVVRHEELDGVETAVLETLRDGRSSQVWLAEVGGKIVRLREETRRAGVEDEFRRFEPGAFRAPATLDGLRVGQTFPSNYDEVLVDGEGELGRVSRSPVWKVEALAETVETPAGRFGAIRLLRLGDEADGTLEKRIWYAPGIGKVKELGNRLELLESYQIVP